MSVHCPYCNFSIEDRVHLRWWNSVVPTRFDFECPRCKKVMEVNVEAEPVFLVHAKSTGEG